MKILWLKTELLHPIDKGGKIRTYQMLRHLKKEHRITYLALEDSSTSVDARQKAEEYCHELVTVPFATHKKFGLRFAAAILGGLLSNSPYFLAKYASRAMREAVARLTQEDRYDVLVCDFLMPAVNIPLEVHRRLPTVLFQHNVEAMIWKRHWEVASNPVSRAFLRSQWRKCLRQEAALSSRFDRVIAVSVLDADAMRTQYGLNRVGHVPTGVDTEYFTLDRREGVAERPHHLVFTGSMDWLPNEDAAIYFTTQVLPLIRSRLPGVTISFVGRNPTRAVRRLTKVDPTVVVTGAVPDIRPFLQDAAAFVVPIRVGGGTRLKIYEAMAAGLPVISTSVGAEGLEVCDGDHLLIADDPAAFAEQVLNVLTGPELARSLAIAGQNFIRMNKSWSRVSRAFMVQCKQAADAFAEHASAG